MNTYPQTLSPGFHLANGVNEELVRTISALKREPNWMLQLRLQGLEAYLSMPMPLHLSEGRTSLRGFSLDEYRAYSEPYGEFDASQLPGHMQGLVRGGGSSGMLVQLDSVAEAVYANSELEAQGVLFTDMDTAVQQHPELVREYFSGPDSESPEDKFAALNQALWSGGLFLYVPQGVTVDEPLYVYHRLDSGHALLTERTVVVMEAASGAVLVQETGSNEPGLAGLHNGLSVVYQRPGSVLELVTIQDFGQSVTDFTRQRLLLGQEATTTSTHGVLGGALSRAEVQIRLSGAGASIRDSSFFVGSGEQHMDLSYRTVHEHADTFSDFVARGALNGTARAVYHGLIRMDQGAQRSSGSLNEKTLLLSDGSRSDATPSLEILADDVKAGHGASVGQLDEEEIFYLMARGLDRKEARNMIVSGFFNPLLERVPHAAARERLQKLIMTKVSGS